MIINSFLLSRFICRVIIFQFDHFRVELFFSIIFLSIFFFYINDQIIHLGIVFYFKMEFWIDIVGSTIFLTKGIFKNNFKEIIRVICEKDEWEVFFHCSSIYRNSMIEKMTEQENDDDGSYQYKLCFPVL